MPNDAEIDALIERLNVLCNPLSEMLPERERLTAFVRGGDEAARFLAALRDEAQRSLAEAVNALNWLHIESGGKSIPNSTLDAARGAALVVLRKYGRN